MRAMSAAVSSRVKERLPGPVRESLRAARRRLHGVRQRLERTILGQAAALYRAEARPLRPVDAWRLAKLCADDGGGGTGLVSIRPRVLHGNEVVLRRGTSDADVAVQTLVHGYHAPPMAMPAPELIWDLGSNIGLTVAHYACLYPSARVVGVEPSPANAALALLNTRPWRDRCTILECAVWHEDGEVALEEIPGRELAGRVLGGEARGEDVLRVGALSLSTLLEREEQVDLLKMDIEGAEREVLRHGTDWACKVQRIVVEVHEPYTVDECNGDLRRLGFIPSVNPKFWVSVLGVRA